MIQPQIALQQEIISALHVKPTIDAEEETRNRVNFLVNYLHATGTKGFVLGISGGQDSTLGGKLAQLAVEQRRAEGHEAEFWAVRLPHGVQSDEDDAQVALDFIAPDHRLVIDIEPATLAIDKAAASTMSLNSLGDFNKGNVKARQRMIAQYAIAGEKRALVIGTDHAAENITGFFTKFGDGAADLTPLAGLNKRQGAEMLRHFNAPESTWLKVPTADLEEGRPALSDEEALGVSYEHLDDYLEGKSVPDAARQRIEHLWSISMHKRQLPPGPADTWWR